MILAVWRVGAESFEAKDFLRQYSIVGATVWSKGDTNPVAQPFETSGFSVPLFEASSLEELKNKVLEFLLTHDAPLKSLRESGVESELDIGMSVDVDPDFYPSVSFSPQDLELIASKHVRLKISVFPARDRTRQVY